MFDGASEEGVEDPAEKDPTLSQQAGSAGLCPGPVIFPMASGAEADKWAQEFGYPLESQTGDISVGSMMTELQAHDEAGRFMLEVYDHIVAAKGGEGSETAAAFLSNFMPLNPEVGDTRKFYCKLVYGDEVISTTTAVASVDTMSTAIFRDGQIDRTIGPLTSVVGSEVLITVSPKATNKTQLAYISLEDIEIRSPAQAAAMIISSVEQTNKFKPYVDWLIFGGGVVLTVFGVGATVGAIRLAGSVAARLLATTALVFEVNEGTEYITGYLGGKGNAYNPLKSSFKYVGNAVGGASGAQNAEFIYNTLNIGVGFGGKIGLFSGSLYAATQMPTACQPVEDSNVVEQPLSSQGDAQRTVF